MAWRMWGSSGFPMMAAARMSRSKIRGTRFSRNRLLCSRLNRFSGKQNGFFNWRIALPRGCLCTLPPGQPTAAFWPGMEKSSFPARTLDGTTPWTRQSAMPSETEFPCQSAWCIPAAESPRIWQKRQFVPPFPCSSARRPPHGRPSPWPTPMG